MSPSKKTEILRTSEITMKNHARGKRVWLQGKWLVECGFERGAAITATFDPEARTMTIALDPEGKRHVAGTAEKPIIDVVGAKVGETFPGASATVTVRFGFIVVEGC